MSKITSVCQKSFKFFRKRVKTGKGYVHLAI